VTATTHCKNCGAEITGRYCAACGQHADVSIPSLHKLLVEALGDLYNFDSRLWRSLGLLFLKPGRLTRAYLEGRRARYVPPFRLYVVLSLLFFFLLAALPDSPDDEDLPVAESPAERGPAAPAADSTAAPAPQSEAGREAEAAVAAAPSGGFGIENTDDGGWECDLGGTESWNPEIRARLQRSCEKIAADKGNSFVRALVDNIPLMMFLFIPIVAAGMKVLYPLARRKYVEHLVFFLHFHAFFFLLATLAVLFAFFARLAPVLDAPVALLWAAGWIYLPVYLFLAMRRVYTQGRLATACKYTLLGGGYFFALMFTLVGFVIYTALTL
jgi:hypothetical protein